MSRPRARLIGWTYDDLLQEIRTPFGHVITLREIAQRMQDDVYCRYDFGGAWTGWRMRGDRLMPPRSGRNGPALKPYTAREFAQWVSEPARRDAQERTPGRPRLYLVK